MSVNNQPRPHFFGDQALSLEAENPDPAKPVVADAPQVPGSRYNPVAIAEPTDPPKADVLISYDDNGNVEQANLSPGQVDPVIEVAGGAQPHFTKDAKPADVRRSYAPTHQEPSDMAEQITTKKAAQKKRASDRADAINSGS